MAERPMDQAEACTPITADCLVQEVVERHPQAIPVFARHGLRCVGCYISPFHTIADTAREYAMHLEPLLGDMASSAGAPEAS